VSTCDKGRYHIHEEYSFVELIKDGKPANVAGEQAEIISTSFDNFAMPLIRYQTNDMAIVDDNNPCACGRTYKTLEKIIGRVSDIIVTPSGRHIGRLDVPFKFSPGIEEGQIIQEEVDRIKVNLLKSPRFQQQDLNNLSHQLQLRLGEDMQIEYNFVHSIPLDKNGKKKFIISKLNQQNPS